jgi:hypothetical protein
MLDAAASKLDGFLWRDRYVSFYQMKRLIWKKISLSPPCKL